MRDFVGCEFSRCSNLARKTELSAIVATVFCDDNKKYLSTDLVRGGPIPGYLSPDIELFGYQTIGHLGQAENSEY